MGPQAQSKLTTWRRVSSKATLQHSLGPAITDRTQQDCHWYQSEATESRGSTAFKSDPTHGVELLGLQQRFSSVILNSPKWACPRILSSKVDTDRFQWEEVWRISHTEANSPPVVAGSPTDCSLQKNICSLGTWAETVPGVKFPTCLKF